MQVKKIIILIFAVVSTGLQLRAQTISDLFTGIPDELVLVVDSNKRLDLMDLYKAGKIAQVNDNLSDTCILNSFSESHLFLSMGKSFLEMAILPMINDSKIICLIRTACAPVCDSRLDFYTTAWKKLETSVFITPVEASWFVKNDKDRSDLSFQLVSSVLNMQLMRFHFDEKSMTLIQTYTTPEYLSKEDRKKIEPYLIPEPKAFRWNNMRFE